MPNTSPIVAATVIGLAIGSVTLASAQTREEPAMTSTGQAAQPAATTIDAHVPAGYSAFVQLPVSVDGETAELIRYERTDRRNAALGGEHFSTVIAADGRLKGFARMDLDLVGRQLPSREEARSIAMAFLQTAAPDLLPTLEISWIEPHDEPLRVNRNGTAEDLTLTGMKVKMRNSADGRWMWVIVGADRKVMVFERDIEWVTLPGHRKTEKWLHDAWLVQNGHAIRGS